MMRVVDSKTSELIKCQDGDRIPHRVHATASLLKAQ